jgi:hypothetical protein
MDDPRYLWWAQLFDGWLITDHTNGYGYGYGYGYGHGYGDGYGHGYGYGYGYGRRTYKP